MSLPSIFEYLPGEAEKIIKLAATEKEEPILMSKEVLKAGLKNALLTSLGVGAGYAGGRLLGHGIDAISQKYFGGGFPTEYVAPATALLGGAAMTAKWMHNKAVNEELRRAHEDSKKRSG